MQMIHHPVAGPVLRLVHENEEALVTPFGAQVIAWRHCSREMLWLTSTPLQGKPLRGGIPVCWPWFGAHPTDASKPSHGVARNRPWHVIEDSDSRVVLALTEDALTATITVSLDDGLRVSLTTHNGRSVAATISAALHTYFAVDDIGDVRVTGLDGAPYIEILDGWPRNTHRGDLRFDAEVDRIYTTHDAMLHDGDRRLNIDSNGTSNSLVAWNPWIAKSARLGDMPEGDYRRMVCLETAWAGDDIRTLDPDASATLTTHLRPLATSR